MLRRRRRKPAYRRGSFWIVCLFGIILVAAGWWLWSGLHDSSHRLTSLLITVNGEPRKILPGEALNLHPKDQIQIHRISTNVPLNIDVRLVAEGLDAAAFQYQELTPASLLPEEEILDHHSFTVQVKYRNEVLGHIQWNVRPYTEDWLDELARARDSRERIAILERALKYNPEERQLQDQLLKEYKSSEQWKKLAAMLEEVVHKSPSPDNLRELLAAYTAAKNKKGVISVLNRMIKQDPNDLAAREQLAEILEESGNLKGASAEYEEVLKRVDATEALPLLEKLGYLYSKTGEDQKAIAAYRKAAEMDKKDANLYYNLSNLYRKVGQPDQADSYLAKAASLQSADVESRLALAQRSVQKGDLKKAKNYLTEILEKDPDSGAALKLMAQVLEKQEKKETLADVYKRILSLEPKNETVMYNLGVLYYEMGNMGQAAGFLENYIASRPQDAETREILFDIYRRDNKQEKALEQARVLVDLKPKDTSLYNYIFDALSEKGDYEALATVMEKAVNHNPAQVVLREYLVVAYLKLGKEEEAIAEMEEILRLRPDHLDILANLAKLREKRGEISAATEAYRRIIELAPDDEEARDAYLRLRLQRVQDAGK